VPLALFLLACRPADRAYPANEVSLVVSSTKLEIGPAALDETANAEVYVWNDAGDGATLSAEARGTGFSVVGGPWPLVGLTQVTITVTYAPESSKTASGTLFLEAGPEHAAVALVGLVTTDSDGDGYVTTDVENGDDCDDHDLTIHPKADEVWYDGVDQNCDGNDLDQDGDGVDVTSDCNDEDRDRSPALTEGVDSDDGVDEDCDGIADETVSAGAWIVTEILVDPSVSPDLYGQFVEVYNASGHTLGLTGWTLESDATSGVVSTVTVESHDYAVLCPSGNIAADEIPCDAFVQPWPTFSADEDSVTLLAEPSAKDPIIQDVVPWDAGWPVVGGASMMFAPEPDDPESSLSNDDPANWCAATTPWAGGDNGSPGLANDCP
jgi:hypothetical protein